jgi:hypothetical protein
VKLISVLVTLSAFIYVDSVAAQTEASRLLGAWQLCLWVTGPATKSAGPSAASGELELKPVTGPEAPTGSIVYNVRYDTTFQAIFGSQQFGPARAVLTAGGWLELVFNPLVDHGAFHLNGHERGDSIVGEWYRTNYADDGYRGAFTLIRRH